ncbi:MAG: hypothetical protein H7Y27_06780 [Gemmatimonadaceae bacterium]|nr:hypothetical protein [Chitinophagaceae bacterium]
MKRFFIAAGIFVAIVLIIYNLWAELGRAGEKKTGWVEYPKTKYRFREQNIGRDSGRGNIIGIRPSLSALNYSTVFNFQVTVEIYLKQLQNAGKLGQSTIIIFPDKLGDGLFALHEKEKVYARPTVHEAMHSISKTNVFRYLLNYYRHDATNRSLEEVVYRMKAAKMADAYETVFSNLAKQYKVTIVAGSIILPSPVVSAGHMEVGKGPLRHVSGVFLPDGSFRIANHSDTLKQVVGFGAPELETLPDGFEIREQNPPGKTGGTSNGFSGLYVPLLGQAWDDSPRGEPLVIWRNQLYKLSPNQSAPHIINIWL